MEDPGNNAVIVTGGSTYSDTTRVYEVLDRLKPTMVIQGGAEGADHLARVWAADRAVRCLTVPADWDKHGRAAGPIRNKEMIDLGIARTIVAFPGGSGTKNCVKQALQAGLTVHEVRHEEAHD